MWHCSAATVHRRRVVGAIGGEPVALTHSVVGAAAGGLPVNIVTVQLLQVCIHGAVGVGTLVLKAPVAGDAEGFSAERRHVGKI